MLLIEQKVNRSIAKACKRSVLLPLAEIEAAFLLSVKILTDFTANGTPKCLEAVKKSQKFPGVTI